MAIRYQLLLLRCGLLATLAGVPAAAQQPPHPGLAADVADILTLPEVHAALEARNPMLAAARARTEAVRSLEGSAALPPDPQLRVGVMNAGLPGLEADMPNSMAPAIEVMQMVPLPGKLALSGRIARRGTAIAAAAAAETGWMLRARAAMPFYEIQAADRQIASLRATVQLLEELERVARAMYASGEGPQTDALRATVEVGRMRAEIERMIAMRATAAARLNALLSRPADTPIPAVSAAGGALSRELPDARTLLAWAGESRPLLREAALEVERAADRTALARRELWPDLSVGVQYGQRAGTMGTERMGSLMVGVTVPVFARQRQLRMREEARAMESMAAAERTDALSLVDASIRTLLAEIDRVRSLTALYETEILPQARAAVRSALASYRAGTVDFMTLVDAQTSLNDFERELAQLEADHGLALAELEMTIGRELPASPGSPQEVTR